MKNKVSKPTLGETIATLKKEAKAVGLEWADEVNNEFSSEIEFLLGLKGRWLLCHIGKITPYTIRFRLIGERDYTKTKPKDFIKTAKQKLLH